MEQVTEKLWICSHCNKEIFDEAEFTDNQGVCDDCYSIPIKKRVGRVN